MRGKRSTGIPKFQSREEEREYWEARGPLAEGHKGRLNKPKPGQLRSSFLTVRLTGEELTRLRDAAAAVRMGPSTYARLILLSASEGYFPVVPAITLRDSGDKSKDVEVPLDDAKFAALKRLLQVCGIQETLVEEKHGKEDVGIRQRGSPQ
ncbi:MAG: hypothetical protein V1849_01520 [Chloroflexota bacterium]